MKRLKVIFAGIILIVSLILLFDRLFTPQPIQIYLESGQAVITQTADYFSLTEVLLFIACAFLIGMTSTYLFYLDKVSFQNFSEKKNLTDFKQGKEEAVNSHESILPLLKEDESRVFRLLHQEKGNLYQNKLARELNLSKVKMTRILSRLEKKNLIVRERAGMTNSIKIK